MDDSHNIVALRERQTELIKIIESIDEVLKTKGWQTLKELVFDSRVDSLERQLLAEAKKEEIDPKKIYKLQGELIWSKRYSDLRSYAEMLKKELEGIKLKLHKQ